MAAGKTTGNSRRGRHLARHLQQGEEAHLFDKTRMCRFYALGQCSRGQDCTFAHGQQELHSKPDLFKTQVCFRFVRTGKCRSGAQCRFAHTTDEIRAAGVLPSDSGLETPESEGEDLSQHIEFMEGRVRQLQTQLEELRAATTSGPQLVQVPMIARIEPLLVSPWHTVPWWQELPNSPSQPFLPTAASVAKARIQAAEPIKVVASSDRLTTLGDISTASFPTPMGAEHEDIDPVGLGFSRQTSITSEGLNDDELRLGASVGVSLFVRNTFIDAEPLEEVALAKSSVRRHARSVPAHHHHHHDIASHFA